MVFCLLVICESYLHFLLIYLLLSVWNTNSSLLFSSIAISAFLPVLFSHFQTDENKRRRGEKKVPKMSCVSQLAPSLTDLLKTPHSSLAIHMARAPHVFALSARCLCARVPLPFRKLIYYCSHSAPLHARLSIWTVVLAVCSNLLLFNCLTTARPTATLARNKQKKCWASLNKEDGQDAIDLQRGRERLGWKEWGWETYTRGRCALAERGPIWVDVEHMSILLLFGIWMFCQYR